MHWNLWEQMMPGKNLDYIKKKEADISNRFSVTTGHGEPLLEQF